VPRALVTGIAGFVGSHLGERLAVEGWDVVGVDCFTPYYELDVKQNNARSAVEHGVTVVDDDLRTADLQALLDGVDVVFHQAGQPGVRDSWEDFDLYVEHNILATRRLLDAAVNSGCARLVYASSSSVYGDAMSYPTPETAVPRPRSPYGVTKLAAENLCSAYAGNFGLSTVSLRYFTVFGPRQRPDMAMNRIVRSALTGEPFPKFGSGTQIRDFTYVADVVEANLSAGTADVPAGTVVNVAGGGAVTLDEVIATVERLVGRPVPIEKHPTQAGDVFRTGGAIEAASKLLGWRPAVSVEEGLARQVEWQRDRT